MKKNFDAVIFDFDGTIADTGRGVFRCIKEAIKTAELPPLEESRLRTFIGPPLHESFMRECGVDFPKAQELSGIFRKFYSAGGVFEFDIYDGIEELFAFLKSNGIRLGVGSSKTNDFVNLILQKTGLNKYFDVAIGSDPNLPEMNKTAIIKKCIENFGLDENSKFLMVGDRKYDIDGAHNAGIPCVAVTFGYGTQEEFQLHNADFIVNSPSEIENVVFKK